MKITRRKKVQRYLSFFKNNFGFRQPYQLLIDGTFCHAALKEQISIREQIPKYLESEVKLLTTQCVVLELEKLGPQLYGALCVAKQFGVHQCGHEKNPITASKCLLSMLGSKNQKRYMIASQDQSLRESSRAIPGTPILYLYQKAPTLEKPSHYSEKTASSETEARELSDFQLKMLDDLKKKTLGDSQPIKKVTKKQKPKGPNPLSCKKKKKKPQDATPGGKRPAAENEEGETSKKKRRRRVKVPKHVKEHWASQQQQSDS